MSVAHGCERAWSVTASPFTVSALPVGNSENDLRQWYREAIEQRIAKLQFQREAYWTDSLAVGSRQFVERVVHRYQSRSNFRMQDCYVNETEIWTVREEPSAYNAFSWSKNSR